MNGRSFYYETRVVDNSLHEILNKDDEKDYEVHDDRKSESIGLVILLNFFTICISGILYIGNENFGILFGIISFIMTLIIGRMYYNSYQPKSIINTERKKRVEKLRQKFDKYVDELITKRLKELGLRVRLNHSNDN